MKPQFKRLRFFLSFFEIDDKKPNDLTYRHGLFLCSKCIVDDTAAGHKSVARFPLRPGQGTSVAHELIRNHISHDSQDRQISPDIETSYHLLKSELVKSVESKIENLN